jgi:hypothetical protein
MPLKVTKKARIMHKQLQLLITIILCLTAAQADACLRRVKEWWEKQPKKTAQTRTTNVLLPTEAKPFPPAITLIILDYLKRTEEAVCAKVNFNKQTVDYIKICDSAGNIHMFADSKCWRWPSKNTPVMCMAQDDLSMLYEDLFKRHMNIHDTYARRKEPFPSQDAFLSGPAQAFGAHLPDNAHLLCVERHDATEQTTERVLFFAGPEEVYLEAQSPQDLFSCCRKTRRRITVQEESKED